LARIEGRFHPAAASIGTDPQEDSSDVPQAQTLDSTLTLLKERLPTGDGRGSSVTRLFYASPKGWDGALQSGFRSTNSERTCGAT